MSSIFDKFDKEMDMDKINNQKKEATENATNFDTVPVGKYIARIEKMELAVTKTDKRPMFKVQMRLVEGCDDTSKEFLKKYPNKKPCVFMNRVIFGTKNDGAMIASVETFLNRLDLGRTFVFTGYSDFAEEILDAEEMCENLEFEIEYDDTKFNSISVVEVFDV